MKIAGIQKLTLLDFPGRCACTVFTPGCNFRCPFCHNASLVIPKDDELVDLVELFEFFKERKGRLTGVAITGGEPLMQDGIEEFMQNIKLIGLDVKLDTNGSYPDKLKKIIEGGLVDYVAMDIKSCKDRYAAVCGLDEALPGTQILIDNVEKSKEILRNSNIEYEFRTTVVDKLHTASDIRKLASEISYCKNYFIQNFKDSGDILTPGLGPCSKEVLCEMLTAAQDSIPTAKLRGVDL